MKNLLVTLADRNYADQARQLFSSVYWNGGWDGDYMLLAQDLPEKEMSWYQDRGILVTPCEPLSKDEMIGGLYPPTILSKLHLFTPPFRKWKRIVFLDADIMVRGSLAHLQKVSGFSARFYGTLPIIEQFAGIEGNKSLYRKLKKAYDLTRDSFNAGVMAFPTDLIAEDMFERLLDITSRYLDYSTFGDEGILNLFFSGRCTPLPPTFNSLVQHKGALVENKAVVLHFNSEFLRPWQVHHPLFEEWSENLKRADEIDLGQLQPPQRHPSPSDLTNAPDSFRQRVIRRGLYSSLDLRIRHPSLFFRLKKARSFLNRVREPKLIYYERYLKAILSSNTMECDPGADLDVHMVTCSADVLKSMWALKTLRHYLGMPFNLVIHEDGSFTDGDVNLLGQHFENVQIVRRTDSDARMAHVLEGHPHLARYRAEEGFYCALKLVDPLFYSTSDRIITLDSDVLFFRRPDRVLELLESGVAFFTSDYMDSYRFPVEVLNDLFNMEIHSRFNAGFLFFQRDVYLEHLGTMESYFKEVDKLERPLNWINRHEQTLHAILMTRLGAERLGPEYSISSQPINDRTVYHHFVSDFSRNTYFTRGLKRLKEEAFLEKFDTR